MAPPTAPAPFPRGFAGRHIGPREHELVQMLDELGFASLEELGEAVIPSCIRTAHPLELGPGLSEQAALVALKRLGSKNRRCRSLIGMGYQAALLPPVIQRNVLENPGWYTQYTPYQAEIAQGRLEALLNFQTMVIDLTGLELANASLLDEATAAAEAMTMCRAIARGSRTAFFASTGCHPQTLAVVETRARPLGIQLEVADPNQVDWASGHYFGLLLQYPATTGSVEDLTELVARAHAAGTLVAVATDLLALTLLRPPGEFGADVALGSTQRFGVPLGFGGPHAAFLATRAEHKRHLPGRIVGVSHDSGGRSAYRLALQTREQHIRRERATSNLCTAQVLLAVVASLYAMYHGPEGLREIASRIHQHASVLATGLAELGYCLESAHFFDTLHVLTPRDQGASLLDQARARGVNLRAYPDGSLGVALDEATTLEEVRTLLELFARERPVLDLDRLRAKSSTEFPVPLRRTTRYLQHAVFRRHHSEHELTRYIKQLEARDLSLTTSMIPLGSCTMKLNPTAAMLPVTWPEFAEIHPFAPLEQTEGYLAMMSDLERWLDEVTGMDGVSLQPNSGAQGEYAGLLVIRAYHAHRGQGERDLCLIPTSAHGTNPASATMAGLKVVPVACDGAGNVDVDDLRRKTEEYTSRLAAIMLTYPSTHGVFESRVRELCDLVHAAGGQVYLDGANLNAQVGLCRPGEYGADVCHVNLHKTFALPHGGGGPGVGPIAVKGHLVPFLPGHPLAPPKDHGVGPVAAAPWGSAGILPIAWMYIAMMGSQGLRHATQVAILNANYLARVLGHHYPVLYRGESGLVAHEFILDARGLKQSAGVDVDDIAKRLMDYGFHAPTMSFPVAGTLMIEPTESEPKQELDRFAEALIAIRREIAQIEQGQIPLEKSPLRRAPHTALDVTSTEWPWPYSRQEAAFPAPHLREYKLWPTVGRIDNARGDRNLVCTCVPMEEYAGTHVREPKP
jgi:glycine dehydrogenase